jgi:hypothetical protein
MFKRAVAATAWFVSTWWVYALLASFLALPAGGGLVIGVLLAALVLLDPTRVFWGPRKPDVTEAQRRDVPGLAAPTR